MNKYILYIVGGLVVLLVLIVGVKYWLYGKTSDTGTINPGDISVRLD